MKAIQTLLVSLLILTVTLAHADGGEGDKYRVVAHKNGATEVESVSNTVIIIGSSTVYIPNAFTPNMSGPTGGYYEVNDPVSHEQ